MVYDKVHTPQGVAPWPNAMITLGPSILMQSKIKVGQYCSTGCWWVKYVHKNENHNQSCYNSSWIISMATVKKQIWKLELSKPKVLSKRCTPKIGIQSGHSTARSQCMLHMTVMKHTVMRHTVMKHTVMKHTSGNTAIT